MGGNAHLVDALEDHLVAYHVGDAVGEGEELLVLSAAGALGLLVAVDHDFGTKGVAARHPFLYPSPLPVLAVGEVDSLVVDKHVLDGGHFLESL